MAIENTKSVLVTQTGITGVADVVLAATTSALVSIGDTDQPRISLTVQAESFTAISGDRLELNSASIDGSMLSLIGGANNETGTATLAFIGAGGSDKGILDVFEEDISIPSQPTTEPIHSLELIASDMELPHEGSLRGVPDYYSWAKGPTIGLGNDPGDFAAITAWGQIYADTTGNFAQNTRVQIRNIKTYVLSRKTGTWDLIQSSATVEGAAYREDYANNTNVPADVRYEADGSVSVNLKPGYNYHFWPIGGRGTIDPKDIGGVFTTVEARLVIDDLTQPDDRNQARLLMNMGGDYWLNTTAGWDDFKTNGDIAIGRFRYIDTQWDSFNMTTLTRDEVYSNPPPILPENTYPPACLDSVSLAHENGSEGGGTDLIFADDNQPLQTLLFEAEQATGIVNYRIENIGAASGDQLLSFFGGGSHESGCADFRFNAVSGAYDVIIGTFDENDGLASFSVTLNDLETGTNTAIGSLLLNANLGSAIANAQTKMSVTVATDIALTPGDTITVHGFEDTLEHARLDFLQLVPNI
jgi:hypothetical protein